MPRENDAFGLESILTPIKASSAGPNDAIVLTLYSEKTHKTYHLAHTPLVSIATTQISHLHHYCPIDLISPFCTPCGRVSVSIKKWLEGKFSYIYPAAPLNLIPSPCLSLRWSQTWHFATTPTTNHRAPRDLLQGQLPVPTPGRTQVQRQRASASLAISRANSMAATAILSRAHGRPRDN